MRPAVCSVIFGLHNNVLLNKSRGAALKAEIGENFNNFYSSSLIFVIIAFVNSSTDCTF